MHPLVGTPAPPLTGELLSGQPLTLDDLSGKPAVVFCGGSECPPCVFYGIRNFEAYEAIFKRAGF
jgi:thiol-disulfide isomerase/thioredoxin